MDLLFKRYASPFQLTDEMISNGMFLDFIDELIKIKNDEDESETLWQFYLHKIFDMSYSDFLNQNRMKSQEQPQIEFSNIETTVNESRNILSSFGLKE